jgi:hypothetical protein
MAQFPAGGKELLSSTEHPDHLLQQILALLGFHQITTPMSESFPPPIGGVLFTVGL